MPTDPHVRHEDVLKKVKWTTIAAGALFLALGILLIVFPSEMQNIMAIVIGIAAIAIGAQRLYTYFKHNKEATILATDLFIGVVACMIGVLFIVKRSSILNYLVLIYGIFLVAGGIIKLQNAIDLRHIGFYRWWIILILALASCVMGLLMIVRPEFINNSVTAFSGLFLIYDGVSSFITVILFELTMKKLKKGIPVGRPVKPVHDPVPGPGPAPGPGPMAGPGAVPRPGPVPHEPDPFDPNVIQNEHIMNQGNAGVSPSGQAMNFDPETGEPIQH